MLFVLFSKNKFSKIRISGFFSEVNYVNIWVNHKMKNVYTCVRNESIITQLFPAVTFCNYAPARFDRALEPFLNATDPNDLSYANSFTPEQAAQVFEYLRQRLNNNESVDQFFFTLDMMSISCVYNGDLCTKDDFILFLSSRHGRCFTFNAQTTKANQTNLRWTSDSGGTGKLQLWSLYT